MAKNIGSYGPSHPLAGKLVEKISRPVVRAAGAALKFYDNKSHYAIRKGQEMRERLSRGESVYLVGIGPSGHNSTVALAEVSDKGGIRPIFNNEEERYTGIRHEDRFPENSLREVLDLLEKMEVKPDDIAAICYTSGTTGQPKGAALLHRNITANIDSIRRRLPISNLDVFLSLLPLHHTFAATCNFLTPISCGSTIVFGSDQLVLCPTDRSRYLLR